MSAHHRRTWEALHISESAAVECRARGSVQIPGRRRVFDGRVTLVTWEGEPYWMLRHDDGETADVDWISGLENLRVRLTVEVIDEPATQPAATDTAGGSDEAE
jgi:hypothetical protein